MNPPTMSSVVAPRCRWTEDERPGPYTVVRSFDGGETWYTLALVDECEDALDIAAALGGMEGAD